MRELLEELIFLGVSFFSLFLSYRDFADGDRLYCWSQSKLANLEKIHGLGLGSLYVYRACMHTYIHGSCFKNTYCINVLKENVLARAEPNRLIVIRLLDRCRFSQCSNQTDRARCRR
jgi:hypothetical protein